MKLQRVYIDTSVIGGCYDEEFAIWSDGLVEDFRAGRFKPVISEVVAAEMEGAPPWVREGYDELRAISEFLFVTEEVEQLAQRYLKKGIFTARFYEDSLHIALATVYRVDVLVSWNFRHIVHFDKVRRFTAANIETGYQPIAIYSPREVTSYGKEDV
jgi:hypothetical protein